MNVKLLVKYWTKSAEEDLKTAESLFISERYQHCLFFCHLFLEKIIKALIVEKTNEHSPYGHKLSQLAKSTGVHLDQDQIEFLDEATSFNLKARYDDYKLQFYKKATKKYTERYFKKSKTTYLWLKQKLSTKK